ncbi:MAG: SUMF1/EgtB/PvdO family nonheme iron enzyme [Blastocatellales bacterium]
MRKHCLSGFCLLAVLSVSLWLTHAQSQRGQEVRIRVESGQEIDLYDESHALIIGVSNYSGGWRKLPGVKTDVAEISRVLRAQGFSITTVNDPTREEFDAALRRFISQYGLRERNRLVIYFAGHGHTERTNDDRDLGYIVLRNAPKPESDPSGFYLASVSMDEINSHALRIKSKHALFVFDSCFSGTIFRSEPEMRVPPAIASLTAAPVRQFITSGAAGQQVPDDSIFRAYFVRAFDQRAGDLNNDGFITGEELGKYLMGSVASDSRDTQTPRFGKIKDAKLNIGDVVFALPKKAAPPTVAPTPIPAFDPLAVELALWNSAQRNDEIADYEDYLRQYPNGRFAVAARNRIARLRAAVITPPTPPKPTIGTTRQNSIGMEFTYIPEGSFMMGSSDADIQRVVNASKGSDPETKSDWFNDEKPQRRVTISRPFFMGQHEVTQKQWQDVMGTTVQQQRDKANPNFVLSNIGPNQPMYFVNWEEVQEFIKRLNAKNDGFVYRLPTEAEWEFAARAGTTGDYAGNLDAMAWYADNSGKARRDSLAEWVKSGRDYQKYYDNFLKPNGNGTHDVGTKAPNAWGLFDMHGNVWEWCSDWYGDYPSGNQTDPQGATTGQYRALRGGSWDYLGRYCRSAVRSWYAPGNRYDVIGFRVVAVSRTQ